MREQMQEYFEELDKELDEMSQDLMNGIDDDTRRAIMLLSNKIIREFNQRNRAGTLFLLVAAVTVFRAIINSVIESGRRVDVGSKAPAANEITEPKGTETDKVH